MHNKKSAKKYSAQNSSTKKKVHRKIYEIILQKLICKKNSAHKKFREIILHKIHPQKNSAQNSSAKKIQGKTGARNSSQKKK